MMNLLHRFQPFRSHLAFFCCCLTVLGLLCSKFLLSVALFGLLATAFVNTNLRADAAAFFRRPEFLAPVLLFLFIAVSGVYCSDTTSWLEQMRLKLPFLGLPITFALLPKFTEKQYRGVFFVTTFLVTVTALSTLLYYYTHLEAASLAVKRGEVAVEPRLAWHKPIHHIRFNLLLLIALLPSIYIIIKKYIFYYKTEKYFLILSSAILFYTLHLLAVRTGILAFYFGVLVLFIQYIIQEKKYLLGIFLGFCAVLLPIISYYTLPSFREKIEHSRYEFGEYKDKNIANNSTAERIISIKTGLKIGNENPIFGVGIGDVEQLCRAVYQRDYPWLQVKTPHNQWVFQYAGGGILGIIIFGFGLFFPLFYKKNYNETLFLLFYSVMSVALMTEGLLETSEGVAFVVLFLSLGLNYLRSDDNKLYLS